MANESFPLCRQDSAAPARKVELEGGLVEEQLRKSWGRIELLKQQEQRHVQQSEEEDDDDDEETEQTGTVISNKHEYVTRFLQLNTILTCSRGARKYVAC